ncbi:MAG: prephenate dehydrogenase [Dehalococcoidia bacterium]|nr:prephenate dehydrogenase [Dehalococcoidia bacterium]
MERIAIIGLGLMGGSLASALKEAGDIEAEITGFSRRSETVARAKDGHLIDRAADDLASAVQVASLVIIATPVMAIREVLKGIAGHLSHGCVVTDVGSTKVKVMEWADEYLPHNVDFIGGHPMAGKETSGVDEADPNLFRGCVYCLTPAPSASPEGVQKLGKIVRSIGAKPFLIDARTHDRLVAGVSHLPMLLSAAFVSSTVSSPSWPEMAKLASRGYRDLSRLASGNPDMNRDICLSNREEIVYWIDCYIEGLKKLRSLVDENGEGLKDALVRAQEARERWLKEEGR